MYFLTINISKVPNSEVNAKLHFLGPELGEEALFSGCNNFWFRGCGGDSLQDGGVSRLD